MKSMPCVFAMVVVGFGVAGSALAQVAPAGVRIEMEDWTFCPLQRSGAVEGFFAYRPDAEATGDNITAVWYTKVNGHWRGEAWSDVATGSALSYLRNRIGLENVSDTLWGGTGATHVADYPAAPAPKAYLGGFYTDDPLGQVVNSSVAADEIKGVLVEIGYAAAAVPVEKAEEVRGLTWQQTLDAAMVGVQTYIRTTSASDAARASADETSDMGGWLCIPQLWCGSWTPTSWTCGSWVLCGVRLEPEGPRGCLYTRKNTGHSSRSCVRIDLFCNLTAFIDTQVSCWDQLIFCPKADDATPCPTQPNCVTPGSPEDSCSPPPGAPVSGVC